MEQRFEYSPAEVARVRTVQFGVLSPDEIVSVSSLWVCVHRRGWTSGDVDFYHLLLSL